jgi:hypothetical protein
MAGPVAPCRLCGNLGELQDSHIIPRWCYERILNGPEGRQPQAVLIDGRRETQSYSNNQLSEYLLCTACEIRCGRWDDYASRILVQEDLSFPWLDMVPGGAPDRVVDAGNVDVDAITRFVYSVVWRGSVSTVLPAPLGDRYEREFAEYLLDRSEVPPRTCAVVKLLATRSMQRQIIPPQAGRFRSCHRHYFAACGSVFQVYVGGLIPSVLWSAHFPAERVVIVGDGSDLKKLIAPGIATYRTVGKLAREPGP